MRRPTYEEQLEASRLRKEMIIKAYQEGLAIKKIEAMVGVTRSWIYYVLNEAGIELNRAH